MHSGAHKTQTHVLSIMGHLLALFSDMLSLAQLQGNRKGILH